MLPPAMLGAVSGALVGVSFRSETAAPLMFVALVPLLAAAMSGVRSAGAAGTLMGVVGYAAVFAWLPEPLTRFQGISIWYAWLFFAAAVFYHALQIVAFAIGAAVVAAPLRLRREPARDACIAILGAAAWWVLLEWGFPKVFPWSLGGALAASPLLRQAADLGGVYGLGFVIVAVNAALAVAVREREPLRRPALVSGLAVVGALAAYGYWCAFTGYGETTTSPPALAVGIVQGALPVDGGDAEHAALRGWQTYEHLTHALLANGHAAGASSLALIIWPETTLAVQLRTDRWYRRQVEQLVGGIDRPLVLGALDHSEVLGGDLNSAFAILPPRLGTSSRAPSQLQVYHKSYLVPWAEYVPGADWLPFIGRWRTTGGYVKGTGRSPLILGAADDGATPLRLAPSICVEGLQAGWFNPLVRAGASLLVNLTDDGWLAGSAGPRLHLQLARMRAVETRRWLVRASNSGISAVIDPSGEIVNSIPFGKAGTLTQLVVPSTRITPYVRFGEWVVWLSLAIVAIAVVVGAHATKAARELVNETQARPWEAAW